MPPDRRSSSPGSVEKVDRPDLFAGVTRHAHRQWLTRDDFKPPDVVRTDRGTTRTRNPRSLIAHDTHLSSVRTSTRNSQTRTSSIAVTGKADVVVGDGERTPTHTVRPTLARPFCPRMTDSPPVALLRQRSSTGYQGTPLPRIRPARRNNRLVVLMLRDWCGFSCSDHRAMRSLVATVELPRLVPRTLTDGS